MPETVDDQRRPVSKHSETLGGAPLDSSVSVAAQPAITEGMNIKDLRTPALLLDLEGMESNLHLMASFFRDRPIKLRPHFKAHQTFFLASRQIQTGSIGISCARLDHAAALVRHGIRDVLIA